MMPSDARVRYLETQSEVEMTYAEFQERYEQEAGKEKDRYDSLTVSSLVEDIRSRRFGEYFQIWYSLGRRAKLPEVGWLLFDILQSSEDYLIRYHYASALISVAELYADGFHPEKLSAREKYPADQHLEEVREILERKLGKRDER